uniref:Uncharacterized protein n=1 Tax=Graphocephala atropunctata TaxID=36148 RepID=A0A1B6LUL3_9HEMI
MFHCNTVVLFCASQFRLSRVIICSALLIIFGRFPAEAKTDLSYFDDYPSLSGGPYDNEEVTNEDHQEGYGIDHFGRFPAHQEMINEEGMRRLNKFQLQAHEILGASRNEYNDRNIRKLPSPELYLSRLAGLLKLLEHKLKRQYDEKELESIYDNTLAIEQRVKELNIGQRPDLVFYRNKILERVEGLKKNIGRKIMAVIELQGSFYNDREELWTRARNTQNESPTPRESRKPNRSAIEGFKKLLNKYLQFEKLLTNNTSINNSVGQLPENLYN